MLACMMYEPGPSSCGEHTLLRSGDGMKFLAQSPITGAISTLSPNVQSVLDLQGYVFS